MARIVSVLEEGLAGRLERRDHPLLGAPTLNVGRISGGVQVNIVPDSCVIEVDRRTLPGETREQVLNEVGDLLSALKAKDPELVVFMDPPTLESLPLETDPSARIAQTVTAACENVTGTGLIKGAPFGSDASELNNAGIPSVICGPGSIAKAHTADECVELDQVVMATEIYVRRILEF